MKRAKGLIEKIAAIDNLYLAFWKARKGKNASCSVIEYREDFEEEIAELQKQLFQGRVEVGDYHYFTIYDPKEREICASAFRERVMHHALMNICHPYFERHQIYDSYASRKEKGTYAALDRAKYFSGKYPCFLKLDFRKYFASIDHELLKQQLRRLFKERKLINIFDQIIDSYPEKGSVGVPIGNLSSQYFANHYLSGLDHFIKEKLRAKAYVRYMDDLVVWGRSKEYLRKIHEGISHYADSLELTLKPEVLQHNNKGLPFLSYIIYPHYVRLGLRSKRRFIEKMALAERNLQEGVWTALEYRRHVLPLIAFTAYADAKAFRKKVLENVMVTKP